MENCGDIENIRGVINAFTYGISDVCIQERLTGGEGEKHFYATLGSINIFNEKHNLGTENTEFAKMCILDILSLSFTIKHVP